MTGPERGFLLLCSHLGDPERKPLTAAQFRALAKRARQMEKPIKERALQTEDLIAMGYDHSMAGQILLLLSQEEQLRWYLQKGKRSDCFPITRLCEKYPVMLRKRLGLDAPGVLWGKGDTALLEMPAVSLVGSRELLQQGRAFAEEAGKQAARQGFVLVSGNARGADRTAQESCLAHGGRVISVVADALEKCPVQENVLYLSEDGFDLAFNPLRALSRNRVIHCLGQKVFIAQCGLRGGTWDGTVKNLKHGWSPVFCCADGSAAAEELAQMGAALTDRKQLDDIHALKPNVLNFIE